MTLPLFIRIAAFALATLLAAAPAFAGESSPRALRREADAQARAAEAAAKSLARTEAEAQALEAEHADLAARRAALSEQAAAATSLWSSDRAALERALAGLALTERHAASPAAAAAAPAIAGLAGHWASRAAGAAADAQGAAQAGADLAARDAALEARRTALDAARTALAEAADSARRTRATLLAQAETAEREARRIAERRAAEKRAAERLAAARRSTVARASATVPAAPAGQPWLSPIDGARVAPGDHPSAVRFVGAPGAIVRAPVDGKISYAGLFRTYGQVLILDGPGGYAFVLSGLDRIRATAGQVVRAGDPLGALAPNADSADLNLEVRKNGKPLSSDRWLKDEIKPRRGVTIAERRKA